MNETEARRACESIFGETPKEMVKVPPGYHTIQAYYSQYGTVTIELACYARSLPGGLAERIFIGYDPKTGIAAYNSHHHPP